MKPIGPLMREHRLIEKMVDVLARKQVQIGETGKVDVDFLTIAVDFFRTYADRTHHGKEEDILFKELAKKQLAPEHKQTMGELVEEHAWARNVVSRLTQARGSYIQGNRNSVSEIAYECQELAAFYPAHIAKEDKHFFYPCLEYFTVEEQNAILEKFWEFDRMLIHEKYQNILAEIIKTQA